jgi:hypothetical protein
VAPPAGDITSSGLAGRAPGAFVRHVGRPRNAARLEGLVCTPVATRPGYRTRAGARTSGV